MTNMMENDMSLYNDVGLYKNTDDLDGRLGELAAQADSYSKFAELILEEIESYIADSEGDIDYIRFLIDRNLWTGIKI